MNEIGVVAGPGTSYSTYSFTTLPHIPLLTSLVASPSSTTGTFGIGATITLSFDVDTNYGQYGSNGNPRVLACSFIPTQSNEWMGVWTNARTYVMNVTGVSGQQPLIGVTYVICPMIRSSDGLSLAANITSLPLSGTWSTRTSLPTLSVASTSTGTTQILSSSYNQSLLIMINQPLVTDRVTAAKLFQLTITTTEGIPLSIVH